MDVDGSEFAKRERDPTSNKTARILKDDVDVSLSMIDIQWFVILS
jgi:hypothetical protein